MSKKIDYEANARYWGLTNTGRDLRLTAHPPIRFGRTLPNRTAQSVAACAVLDLTYWSDHPQTGMVWATDFHGRFHEVRLDRRAQTSSHVCGRSHRLTPEGSIRDTESCSEAGRTASWLTAATPQELCEQLNGEWVNYVEPTKLTAAERRHAKARNAAKAAQRDAEMEQFHDRAYQKAKAAPRKRAQSDDTAAEDWAASLVAELLGEEAS